MTVFQYIIKRLRKKIQFIDTIFYAFKKTFKKSQVNSCNRCEWHRFDNRGNHYCTNPTADRWLCEEKIGSLSYGTAKDCEKFLKKISSV